jgi:glycosyltransferase involved in cell wall biosynthesis
MRVAIISDASSPTPTPGAHGLGRAVHTIAERLYAAGHDVTLFATTGSTFSGELVTPIPPSPDYLKAENALAHAVWKSHKDVHFDVVYDHSHSHAFSRVFPDVPTINHFHDKWQTFSRNPILCSEGQRSLMPPEFAGAKVIHHQLDARDFTPSYRAENGGNQYLLYMGVMRDYKQPILAIEAAARVGMKLKIAGGAPFDVGQVFSGNENAQYVGVVDGENKLDLLRGATALLQFGLYESFGLSTIEAGLCGTPVVALAEGGTRDIVQNGTNGVYVKEGNYLEAITAAKSMSRKVVREFTEAYFGCPEKQVAQVERALNECAIGWHW